MAARFRGRHGGPVAAVTIDGKSLEVSIGETARVPRKDIELQFSGICGLAGHPERCRIVGRSEGRQKIAFCICLISNGFF
jgi:hypothetical protein